MRVKYKMKLSKKIIFAIVAAVIIGAILLTCLGMEIAFLVADKVLPLVIPEAVSTVTSGKPSP